MRPLSAEDLHLLFVVFGEVPQLSQSGTAAISSSVRVLSPVSLFTRAVPFGCVFILGWFILGVYASFFLPYFHSFFYPSHFQLAACSFLFVALFIASSLPMRVYHFVSFQTLNFPSSLSLSLAHMRTKCSTKWLACLQEPFSPSPSSDTHII